MLLQNNQPVYYASKALNTTEIKYAPIEKEALGILFAVQKFHHYIYGRKVEVVSDHKPLEIIARKPLLKSPKRL